MARPDPEEQPTTFTYLDERHYAAFAESSVPLSSTFAGGGPHRDLERAQYRPMGYRPVDPKATQRSWYRLSAGESGQSEVVVLAGYWPDAGAAGDPEGMNDLDYLQRMLAAGAGEMMDGLAVHAYGWRVPPMHP
jgi:hypothetical protein